LPERLRKRSEILEFEIFWLAGAGYPIHLYKILLCPLRLPVISTRRSAYTRWGDSWFLAGFR
jgi:hypothetical protein